LVSLETLLFTILGRLRFASKVWLDFGPGFLSWSLLVRLLDGGAELLLFFFILFWEVAFIVGGGALTVASNSTVVLFANRLALVSF